MAGWANDCFINADGAGAACGSTRKRSTFESIFRLLILSFIQRSAIAIDRNGGPLTMSEEC